MQQTIDSRPWAERSRLNGALRFYWLKITVLVLWVLGIKLGAELLSVILTLFGVSDYVSGGISTDFGTGMLVLLVLACLFAKGYTTFLLRFGTPRLSVWLGSLMGLLAGGVLFLVGSLLLSVLVNYAVLLLSGGNSGFSISLSAGVSGQSEQLTLTLLTALGKLPMMLLWTLEWACLFYLLGCCLRRNKALTITVCLVGPLVCWLLLLLPAVREAMETVEGGDSSAMLMTGMQWMQWFSKAAGFIGRYWQWIQGGAALASLPLSYLCMRNTPQP